MVVVIDIENRIGVQENNIIRLDTLIPGRYPANLTIVGEQPRIGGIGAPPSYAEPRRYRRLSI